MATTSVPFPVQDRDQQSYNSRNPPVIGQRRQSAAGEDPAVSKARRASVAAIGPPPPIALPELPFPAGMLPQGRDTRHSPERARRGSSSPDMSRRSGTGTSTGPRHAAVEMQDPHLDHELASDHPYAMAAMSSRAFNAAAPLDSPSEQPLRSPSEGIPPTSNHSKSVLTVALSKANAAVQLDESNDIEGAIVAYGESVRLLQDVMTRVEHQNNTWMARERERIAAKAGPTDVDTADRDRREERIAKREKSRLEDIKRIKDIHDTYQDRITMLQSMLEFPPNQIPTKGGKKPKSKSPPVSPRPGSSYTVHAPVPNPRRSSLQTFSSDEAERPEGDDIGLSALPLGSPVPEVEEEAQQSDTRAGPRLSLPPRRELARQSIASILADVTPSLSPSRNLSLEGSSSQLGPHERQVSTSTTSSGDGVTPITAREFSLDWPHGEIDTPPSKDGLPGSHKASLAIRSPATAYRVPISHIRPSSKATEPGQWGSKTPDGNLADSQSNGRAIREESREQTSTDHSRTPSSSSSTPSAGALLVSSSTAHGTISQRRRSPLDDLNAKYGGPKIGDGDVAPPETRNSQAGPSITSRLRAISQPGKRPALSSVGLGKYPELPHRASSGVPINGLRQVSTPNPAFIALISPPLPHTPQSSSSAALSMGTTAASSQSPGTSVRTSTTRTPNSSSFKGRTAKEASAAAPSSHVVKRDEVQPLSSFPAFRRPFEQMRRLRCSIMDGAFLTSRLFVPPNVWSVVGVKLGSVETKIRVAELLISALEGVEGASDVAQFGRDGPAGAEKLLRELDSFDSLLDVIQGTLAKKLGFTEAPKGRKSSSNSISALSSKLSKSFDRMTNKGLDAPALYVDTLGRLFQHAQIIDRYLSLLGPDSASPATAHNAFPTELRSQIETRLKRVSDFFATVVCRFVLQDVGMLLDKHVKVAGRWTLE